MVLSFQSHRESSCFVSSSFESEFWPGVVADALDCLESDGGFPAALDALAAAAPFPPLLPTFDEEAILASDPVEEAGAKAFGRVREEGCEDNGLEDGAFALF